MCFTPKDRSADIAAQQNAQMKADEAERQGKIKQGQAGIDTAFGQFDEPYYGKYREAYTGNYNPQVADQYEQNRDKLTAVLAGRGMLESTVGADALGRLDKTRKDTEAQIGNSAVDASNQLKGQVENTKTNLYSLNSSAADPEGIAARATGEATALTAPQAYTPLAQVFAGAMQPWLQFARTDATSPQPKLPWNTFSAPLSGRGSAVYVT